VSLSSGDEVPHIFTRKSRLQPGEFLITSAKRLLQQYLPEADIACLINARRSGWIHSITRSARTSTEDGIVIPNSFATFWFTVSSKRVGCMIGSSARMAWHTAGKVG
jgi:hypothetical protein